jgi:hypothetical protein
VHSIKAHNVETLINRGRDLFHLIRYAGRRNASHRRNYIVMSADPASNRYMDAENEDVKTLEGLDLGTLLISGSELPEATQLLRDAGAQLKARGPRLAEVIPLG